MRGGRCRTLAAAATVVLVGVVGACGGDEDPPGGASGSGSASGTGAAPSSAPGAGSDEHEHHGGGGAPAFDRAAADTGLDVVLRDFAIDGLPGTALEGPKVFFSARNDGPAEHELVIVHEDGREAGGIAPFAKGGPKQLAVELPPGRYRAQCLVREGARTHAELGMQTDFTVE